MREFLKLLEDEGEFVRVSRQVDPVFELAAVLEKIQETTNKAVIFEKVKDKEIPVVSNILGTPRRVALSLNCDVNDVSREWIRREQNPYPPKVVADGPCKEVLESGENLDLKRLPIITHREKDAGPYITAGVVFARDPEFGTNASFNRMQLVDGDRLRISMGSGFHLGEFYGRVEREDKPLEVAICIGSHPSIMWAGVGKLPLGSDHLNLAGALRGEPIEVVRCETSNIFVPIETEIVIEGRILPHIREIEGPFGDYQRYYTSKVEKCVVKVDAITHREKPIYQTILAGSVEDRCLHPGYPVSAEIYRAIRTVAPGVVDVACWPHVFTAVVKMKKKKETEPPQALLAGLGANVRLIKIPIIVDEDVDIYNMEEVMWAVSTRCRPERIIIVPGIPLYARDPHRLHYGKVGIDATMPIEAAEKFLKTKVVGKDKINISSYLNNSI
jgi:4-hydroxybenzoate decarboxylase